MTEPTTNAREVFRKNLNRYMQIYGIDQVEIVNRLGITASTVSDWVNGKKYPRVDAMQRLADLLGVAMSDLTADKESFSHPDLLQIRRKRVRLLGDIAAGMPIYAEEDYETFICCNSDIRCDFALKVRGDSMINARINDGDVVFIREQPDVEDGEIAATIIDDSVTLKRVYHIPGGLNLVSENPKYMPMFFTNENSDFMRILGKAVAFQSNL